MLFPLPRQSKDKGATLAGRGVHPNLAAVGFNDAFANIEPQLCLTMECHTLITARILAQRHRHRSRYPDCLAIHCGSQNKDV